MVEEVGYSGVCEEEEGRKVKRKVSVKFMIRMLIYGRYLSVFRET